MNIKNFYDEYFLLEGKKQKSFKDEFLFKLTNNKVYKFVSFTNDINLNLLKLSLLKENKYWASRYDLFLDKNEGFINYDGNKLYETFNTKNVNEKYIKMINRQMFNKIFLEIYDICCFTYDLSEQMWNDYANYHNGFCQEIEIIDGDEFFPIIYTDDLFKDYTDELKNILGKQKYGQKLTGNDYKPLILSNKTKSLNYKYEKEIRIFHNPFCEGHPILLNDTVYENKKRELSYIGEPFSIESKGGKIINTIIGKACSEEMKEKIIQICDENGQDYEIE